MSRRGLSASEQVEVWRRWRRGEPQQVIAAALGWSHPTIGRFLRRTGGYVPRVRCRAARVLQSVEREEISRGLAVGQSLRSLARQ